MFDTRALQEDRNNNIAFYFRNAHECHSSSIPTLRSALYSAVASAHFVCIYDTSTVPSNWSLVRGRTEEASEP
jgi:hypothetical protein